MGSLPHSVQSLLNFPTTSIDQPSNPQHNGPNTPTTPCEQHFRQSRGAQARQAARRSSAEGEADEGSDFQDLGLCPPLRSLRRFDCRITPDHLWLTDGKKKRKGKKDGRKSKGLISRKNKEGRRRGEKTRARNNRQEPAKRKKWKRKKKRTKKNPKLR